MTAKEFLMRELNLTEEYLKATTLTSKMVEDMMEAYHEFKKREKLITGDSSINIGYGQLNNKREQVFNPYKVIIGKPSTTNDTQEPYK
jgi:hypothetical protein